MVKKDSILKADKVIKTSEGAMKRIEIASKNIGNKDLFQKKIDLAKKTLSVVKTLPI